MGFEEKDPASRGPESANTRLDFLLSLDDATRPLVDAAQITQTAATQLGEYLQVSRCAYADVESDEDTFNLTGNYNNGVRSIVGRYTFTDFGAECLRLMRAGQPYIVEDSEADPRTVEVRKSYRLTEIRSVICVPLLKARRFVAAMAVHQKSPRKWTAEEVELLLLVASRCWESIERARVTRELQDARDRLRAAISAGEVSTWIWHVDRAIVVGDRNVARLFGRQQEEIAIPMDEYVRIVHRADVGELRTALQRCASGSDTNFETDYRIVLPDGAVRYVNARGRMERDAAGRAVRMPGVLVDVTVRKRTEEELRATDRKLQQANAALERKVEQRTGELLRSERQFAQLVAGVTDCALYMLDLNGRVTSWNPGAARIKGYSAGEIIGRHFSEFYSTEDRRAGLPEQTLSSVTIRGKFEGEGWRVRKDGTRFWASVLIDPIYGPDRQLVGYAKITRDMTERRAMQEQLNQSQKMEAIGQLTGGVAHDFNNLLTVILGNLDTIARRSVMDAAKVNRAVEHATRGAQRAAALTQQLLAFSRRQPLNPKPTDVNHLVKTLADLLRRTFPEAIEIETLACTLWRAEVDPNQLENALLNLAVNARDSMSAGGKLTIETANVRFSEEDVSRLAEISAGEYVVIHVSDTGTGMSSEVLARAFDPFFTTKPIGQGTGLGLSQVFGFVKQSGGHIRLHSEVGHGTTVKLYLPRTVGDDTQPESETRWEAPRGSSAETILVVEDEDDVRIYSTECLMELGFTVLQAVDGPSALRVLANHPEVRVLFTDVGLPGLNGRELMEKAREIRPQLPVLFTTGYARDAIVHHGRLDPGVELLTKPFTRGQLAERIRRVLDAVACRAI